MMIPHTRLSLLRSGVHRTGFGSQGKVARAPLPDADCDLAVGGSHALAVCGDKTWRLAGLSLALRFSISEKVAGSTFTAARPRQSSPGTVPTTPGSTNDATNQAPAVVIPSEKPQDGVAVG